MLLKSNFKKKIKSSYQYLIHKILSTKSDFAGKPVDFYKTTLDYFNTYSFKLNSQKKYIEIYPSELINRSLPKTIESEIYWKFTQYYGREAVTAFVSQIPNGRLWGDSAVISSDHKLISDLSIFVRVDPDNPLKHPVFHSEMEALQKINGTIVDLSTMGANTYFHWMIDLLPRIDLIRRSGIPLEDIDFFRINGSAHSFQQETLKILGIPTEKWMNVSDYPHVTADLLVVPSIPRHRSFNIGKWTFEFLRNEFLLNQNLAPSHPRKRIYISRAKATRRTVINEAEVMDILSSLGFEKIELESMSVVEQAGIFADAEYVVAPHGAGLTNLIFANPGTKVLEIFSPNYVSISYWNISNQLDLDYYYMFSEGERPAKNTDPHKLTEDILINIDSFKQALKFAEIN